MLEASKYQLKFAILSSPGAGKDREYNFQRSEIFVGRSNSARKEDDPSLDLTHDFRVSRKHARVWMKKSKWYIEDLGSKHGTRVGGREIKDLGAVELPPGTPVQTGDTTWTTLPADWLFTNWDSVIIFGPCVTGINYALYHCGTPIIGQLTARNLGEQRSAPAHVKLEVVGFSDPADVEIPSLHPGTAVSLRVPTIRLRGDLLRKQVVRIRARLRAEVKGRPNTRAEKDIFILGFWDWPYDASARKTIAAFVSPHNPVTKRIVFHAQANLKSLSGTSSFRDLLKSGQKNTEHLVLQAIYQCLKEQWPVYYVEPELDFDPERVRTCQRVRPPHRIFLPDSSTSIGEATCLDLALLMAGCLENVGLHPLIVFTGDENAGPKHAFAGCWAGPAPGDRPVIYDVGLLRREVKQGNLLVLECTGFARSANRQRCKLGFGRAVKSAIKQLTSTSWVCAVDVGALRPPHGLITPMECPLEPEVGRAYDEAKRFAELKKRETIETTHLFYGCLAAKGEVVLWLFTKAGINCENVRQHIENLVKTHAFIGEPCPTRNYLDCCRLAEDIAWQTGSPTIREEDLLWAILTRGPDSAKFGAICQKICIDMALLVSLLAQRHPCPEIPITAPYTVGPEE